MRTNISTLVTLDTVFYLPFGHVYSNSAFFKFSGSGRESTVFITVECADRQVIPFLCIHHIDDIADKFRTVFIVFDLVIRQVLPFGRNSYLYQVTFFTSCVNSCIVHIDNGLTFLTVWLVDSVFHFADSHFIRNNIGNFEECTLHYGIRTVAQP